MTAMDQQHVSTPGPIRVRSRGSSRSDLHKSRQSRPDFRCRGNSVAKLFLGQSNARLIRVAILPGKNDSLKSRSRFFRCAKVVAIRVLQQYRGYSPRGRRFPADGGHSQLRSLIGMTRRQSFPAQVRPNHYKDQRRQLSPRALSASKSW